jgi:uncharacterized delta-60 repeat protein
MKNILHALFFAAAFSASAQTVTLDETFDSGMGLESGYNVFKIEKLANGQIMIAGNFDDYNGTPAPGIAKINDDGSIDDTFNVEFGGSLVTDFVVEEDGKVVIVSDYGGMFRLNADGSFDTTFESALGFETYSVVKQEDKYIVTGSFTRYSTEAVMYENIARVNSDGSIDGTFAGTSIGDFSYASILQQEDGKMLLTGTFGYYNGVAVNDIVRLNADGSIDTTFNTGTGSDGWIRGRAQQPDGKYIVTGAFMNFNGQPVKQIVRLNSDGSIDDTFAYTSNIVGLPEDGIIGFDVAIQEDGKIIVGGRFYDAMTVIGGPDDGSIPFTLVRLNADGSTDSTFTVGEGFNGSVYAVELKEDSAMTGVYVGGQFTQFNGIEQNNLALLHEEVLDTQSHTTGNILVYPNPATDRLFVSTPENGNSATVKLTDTTGKVIKNTEPANDNGIDVSGLATGVYFAEIKFGDTTEVKKIIKQ